MAIRFMHVIETNLLLGLYKLFLHFNSCLKQLYISNKKECFSYTGVWHMHTDGFEIRVAWAADKWFCVTIHGKVLVEEILVNYSDKSCWQGKVCEYGSQ